MALATVSQDLPLISNKLPLPFWRYLTKNFTISNKRGNCEKDILPIGNCAPHFTLVAGSNITSDLI
jgi:hypothetical protein